MRVQAVLSILVAFLICTSAKAPASERVPTQPNLTEDSFLIYSTNFECSNISQSYGSAILLRVKQALYYTLARGEIDPYYFYEARSLPHPIGHLLDLNCRLERTGNMATLSVVLTDHSNGHVYLDETYTDSFFYPNALIADFYVSILHQLGPGPQSDFLPSAVSPGFSSNAIQPYILDGISYSSPDFEYDLRMTSALPEDILGDFKAFNMRKDLEFVAVGVGMAVFTGALLYWRPVTLSNVDFGRLGAPSVALGSAIVSAVAIVLVYADLPSGTMMKLNAWRSQAK
jgi:hypothetical protein